VTPLQTPLMRELSDHRDDAASMDERVTWGAAMSIAERHERRRIVGFQLAGLLAALFIVVGLVAAVGLVGGLSS
jgi:hypothetical protein